MVAKLDRIGEENINTFGSKMIIKEYRDAMDIDVYFPEYNWTAENVQYDQFKKGNVKCPYERRLFNIGYLGEGEYKVSENRKLTKCYKIWCHMLERCYDEKSKENRHTLVVESVMNGYVIKILPNGFIIIIIQLKMKKCVLIKIFFIKVIRFIHQRIVYLSLII